MEKKTYFIGVYWHFVDEVDMLRSLQLLSPAYRIINSVRGATLTVNLIEVIGSYQLHSSHVDLNKYHLINEGFHSVTDLIAFMRTSRAHKEVAKAYDIIMNDFVMKSFRNERILEILM